MANGGRDAWRDWLPRGLTLYALDSFRCARVRTQWTLNWDPVLEAEAGKHPGIIVGSCPRSAADMQRLVDEAGVSAVLSLQSDLCLEALEIDWEGLVRPAGAGLGVLMHRVGVRDFDRLDQAAMLPVAVRALAALCRACDGRGPVYVHCTAGINRASLTVLGYLTFALGMSKDEALALIREQRPQANPYVVPWEQARARLLAGREQEVFIKSTLDVESTQEEGGDWVARDWGDAEAVVLCETFRRMAEADALLMRAAADVACHSLGTVDADADDGAGASAAAGDNVKASPVAVAFNPAAATEEPKEEGIAAAGAAEDEVADGDKAAAP